MERPDQLGGTTRSPLVAGDGRTATGNAGTEDHRPDPGNPPKGDDRIAYDNRRPKGTGSIRERNGRYQATYSFIDGAGSRQRRAKVFDTKTAARGWLNERLAEVATGHVADAGGLTLGQYLSDWLGSLGMSQLEAATMSWYRSAATRHIMPAFGSVKLAKLSPVMIESFLAGKAENGRLDGTGGLGPASVRRLQVTLRKALEAAVRKGMLARNPADLADSPRMPPRDVTVDVWTSDELSRFIEATQADRLAAVWRLAAMSGLRRSELVGLQWPDIDLDGGWLSVRRSVVIVDGGPPIVKPPKTAKSRRTVELDGRTLSMLREWRRTQLEERLRAGDAWKSGNWVVADELGAYLRPDRLGKRFVALSRTAGLRTITIRQLRHSHATALLAAGESPKVVQERLGHSSISVTLDVYSAVLPNMQREAVERLAEMFDA
jgi:integrase